MKKKFVGALLVLSLSIFSLTACGDKTEPTLTTTKTEQTTEETTTEETTTEETTAANNLTFGVWDGTVFSNEWLNMKFTFPEDITIGSTDLIKQNIGATANNMLINPGDNSSSVEGNPIMVYDCLVVFGDQSSNFQILYAASSSLGINMTPENYLSTLKIQFEALEDVNYQCNDIETIDIAGQAFYRLPMTISDEATNQIINQDYYCLEKDNYFVNFVVSYVPDTSDTIDQVIAGITAIK